MTVKNILLVDDHQMFRWGVRQFLQNNPAVKVVGDVTDGASALEFVRQHSVDIVFLDIEMPTVSGLDFLSALNKSGKSTLKVIVLSQSANEHLYKQLKSKIIHGYILKSEFIGEITHAIEAVCRGESYFSPGIARNLWDLLDVSDEDQGVSSRELEVAKLISEGHSTMAIADALGCAASTVKTHRSNLMRKIGAKNSAEVARWATLQP
jgi:DNA-binding NarL/FixJ family response regulator